VSASINYTNQFSHKDWIDFVDSIQAGGANGINRRMNDIAAEFEKLSQVISLINTSLVVPPPSFTLTFAPALLPNGAQPAWVQSSGVAAKSTSQPGADGWMQLQLPDGVHLQTVTIIGTKSGNLGSFSVQLGRQALTGGAVSTLLAIPLAGEPDTFQATGQVPAAQNQVDNSVNKYLMLARIVGADAAATAQLTAIQILCKRS
jgi:hypothetical protein